MCNTVYTFLNRVLCITSIEVAFILTHTSGLFPVSKAAIDVGVEEFEILSPDEASSSQQMWAQPQHVVQLPATEITFVAGQRGSRKIMCDGYTFICAKTKHQRKYWVCGKQRSRNCKARLITDVDETMFLLRQSVHTHDPQPSRGAVLQMVDESEMASRSLLCDQDQLSESGYI